jgi:hypothetical protein
MNNNSNDLVMKKNLNRFRLKFDPIKSGLTGKKLRPKFLRYCPLERAH